MISNYLTSLLRYISRNKGFTAINVTGLTIGMVACMLITQFVVYEFGYDNFHAKKSQIFRLQLDRYNKGELTTRWAAGAAGIGPDLKANFGEVEAYVRLNKKRSLLSRGDIYFKEDNVFYSSEDFFKIFSFKLLQGENSSLLKAPFKIVLSQSLAKKYFGNENPLGKTLKNNNREEYEVTGVFEDMPENTHMKIDALVSFSTLVALTNNPATTWHWDYFHTYVLLNENVSKESFEAKLPAFVQKQQGDLLKEQNADMIFHLQAIKDIHLDSDFMGEFKSNGSRDSVYFLSVVAVLILIIAWINYVNLSTAKSIERAREVGVRKAMGSKRGQLVQQFLFDSFILNFAAISLSVVLVLLLTPAFGKLTGREIEYGLFQQNMFWLGIIALILFGTLLSGLYPAFVLSGYKPSEVLKGKFKNSNSGLVFRKGMAIAQFVASMTLIVGTFTVYQQIDYMRQQDLGVNIEQTLVLQSPSAVDSTYERKYQVFKNQVAQHSEVITISASSAVPGNQPGWNAGGIRTLSQSQDEANQYRIIMMDHDFIQSYKLQVLAGRGFSGEITNESGNVILNEAAYKIMGFSKAEDAIDDQILFWGDTFKIIGVIKNYHQESLKKSYEPLIFRYSSAPGGFYSIRFKSSNMKG